MRISSKRKNYVIGHLQSLQLIDFQHWKATTYSTCNGILSNLFIIATKNRNKALKVQNKKTQQNAENRCDIFQVENKRFIYL